MMTFQQSCAIVRVIGWGNFLDDSRQKPHMKLTAIDKTFSVTESTGRGQVKAIRTMLKILQFDFQWMLHRRIEESPMDWMIEVNGFLLDTRRLNREVQVEAFKNRLIPYIPGQKPTIESDTDEEEGLHP